MVFKEVVKRSERVDGMLLQLRTSQWRVTLWSLYLLKAVAIPDESKTCSGASFGYCSEDGTHTPQKDSTHLGWTLTHEVI